MQENHYRSQYLRMQEAKRAMVAFNIQNVYHLEALSSATAELGVPAIAQVSAKFLNLLDSHYGLKSLVDRYQCERVFFHLDHCCDPEIISFAAESGFAGVMFDGSHLPIEENIRQINEIYPSCFGKGALMEVELGAIAGVEDGVGVERGSYFCENELYQLCDEARFDLLAVAIGNAHGEYESTDGVKVELLGIAKGVCGDLPLVLHGGTGLPDDIVFRAIEYGVAKINISTALKIVTHEAIARYQAHTSSHDETKFSNEVIGGCAKFFRSQIKKFTC